MAAAPKHPKKSPAQVAASKRFAAAGRSSQAATRSAAIAKTGKPPPRSKKQQAASRNFASAGRAAQAARRAGKQPVKPRAAAAPDIRAGCDISTQEAPSLHQYPVCAPVAAAAHLAMFTGIHLPDEAVWDLYRRAGAGTIPDLLERLMAEGFTGPETRLAHFERCDPDDAVPGLLCCAQLPGVGYHAVLLREGGMESWGQLLPLSGTPAEAWWLEWEAE